MRLRLGEVPQGEGLVDLLMACHARIRRFSALAVRLGEGAGEGDAERAEAAHACLRYFTHALPLHAEDEEASCWPRLAGHSPTVDGAIAANEAEHAAHRPLLAELEAALLAFLEAPSGLPERTHLAAAARALEPALRAHLEAEESLLFPALRTHLPPEVQETAVRELRARRQR